MISIQYVTNYKDITNILTQLVKHSIVINKEKS